MRDQYYNFGAGYSESYKEKKLPRVDYKAIFIARLESIGVRTNDFFHKI
jgi:hypothetical protein